MKAMSSSVPRNLYKLPKWDLSLVLDSLLKAPYEPIAKASLRDLTLKTVFLLALASAKRVSELQGLSPMVSHTEDWTKMSFSFGVDFVALSSYTGEEDDLLLCPVRATRRYLALTRPTRPERSRLFLPLTGDSPSVSKNTISRWITLVIRLAYQHQSSASLTLHKVSAHEVRALSTSWAFHHNASLDDVMAAASWKSHGTFS